MRRVLFTICARAGSKGLKNKNVQNLMNIPLVYYTLAAIDEYRGKHPDEEIVVAANTDSKEIIQQIQQQKVISDIRFIERKEDLADDLSAKVDVIKDTYLNVIKSEGVFDTVVDLDLTSPLRGLKDIEGTINQLVSNEDYDLAFSVVNSRRNPYFNMVEEKGDTFYKKVCDSNFTARQQTPKCYELNASIYAYRPSFLNSKIDKTILDYKCGIWIMKDYLVLDIDSGEDFKDLEYLLPYYIENDEDIFELRQRALEIYESV